MFVLETLREVHHSIIVTWRRGSLFILAVFAFVLIQQRAPDMLSEEEQASVSKVSRVKKTVKGAKKTSVAADVPAQTPVSYYQALMEDRFCEVVAADSSTPENRTAFFRSLGLDQEESVSELASADSPYFADSTDKTFRAPNARFMQALQLAHMLESNFAPKPIPQYERAREILSELSEEFPANAAYSVFLLKVEDELGRNPEEMSSTVARIMRAEEFNSHVMDLNRIVADRAQINAAKFFASITYRSTAPVPEYGAIKFIRDLDLEYPGLKEKVGRLLTREGLAPRKRGFILEGFNAIEYSLGRSFLSENLPNYLELDRARGLFKADNSAGMTALIDIDGQKRKCDDGAKTDFYAAMREIL